MFENESFKLEIIRNKKIRPICYINNLSYIIYDTLNFFVIGSSKSATLTFKAIENAQIS